MQSLEALARTLLDPSRLQYFWEESRGVFVLLNVLAALVALRVYCWVLLAVIHASLDPSLGIRDSLRRSKGRGYAFLALFVVQQVILQAGAMLFLLPGIILAVRLGFACWVFARERAGVFQSLGGSARVVEGHFFGVLGRMLFLGLIGGAWMLLAWGLLYEDLRGPSPQMSKTVRHPQAMGAIAA